MNICSQRLYLFQNFITIICKLGEATAFSFMTLHIAMVISAGLMAIIVFVFDFYSKNI